MWSHETVVLNDVNNFYYTDIAPIKIASIDIVNLKDSPHPPPEKTRVGGAITAKK